MAVSKHPAKIRAAPFLAVSSMDNLQHRPTLLDLPISFFAYDYHKSSFANVPAQQTTLRRIISTNYYKPIIDAIRAETDKALQDRLKKELPAITPVSLLYHRRRDTSFSQKIQQQWPLLMGDVDRKDNPGIDMAELKKHLSRLPYVLLCAYSVRGGLWFIVRLPDQQSPETLAAHFRYLQQLFSNYFGVKLDSSKGGNPTDLRFVSYDATPYINESATVMAGMFNPPKPVPKQGYKTKQHQSNDQDEGQLLIRLVRFTKAATEGQRHLTLLKAATLAGGYIATGRIDEQTAVYALETTASDWPTFTKSQKTIRDGIRNGLTKPIYPEEQIKGSSRPANPGSIIVRTIAEQLARPGSILKPDESQLERLNVELSENYPVGWDLHITPR